MAVRWGVLAYGIAVGMELLAAVALLVAARVRRPLDHTVLNLGVLALLTAALTVLTSLLHLRSGGGGRLVGSDRSFVVASLTAFGPFAWCVALVWRRPGDPALSPATVFLAGTVLFAGNRYDALVAAQVLHSVYIQPFAFAAFAGGLTVYGVRLAVDAERSLAEALAVDELRRLSATATELRSAVKEALAVVGPMVGAHTVRARLRLSDRAPERFEWHLEGPGIGDAVTTVPVAGGGVHWGTLHFISRAPPHPAGSEQSLAELAAREIATLIRTVRARTRLRDAAAADERGRIARELHDSVSQTLYSIAMVSDALPDALDRDPAVARDHARQIRSMTLQALGDTRVLLLQMRDSAMEAATLGGLLEQFRSSPAGPVVVELDISGEPDLPAEVKLAAHRIAQEAVTNAQRHALPNLIGVRLVQTPDTVNLSISDDGGGFEPREAAAGRHGLRIMRERATDVGADLEITTVLGEGTVVRLRWPGVAGGPRRPGDP